MIRKNEPVKMTDRWARSVKPRPEDGGRSEYFDTDIKGLFLRVSGETRVWGWRFRSPLGNGQPRMRLGHYVPPEDAIDNPDALTVAGARAKARRLRSLVDEGRDPAAEAKAQAEAAKAQPLRSVADLAKAFFTACEKGRYRPRGKVKRESTIAGERWLWAKHLEPHFGTVKIDALSRAAISKPLEALADAGKGVTANRARGLLFQLYAYAMKVERVASNPVAKIDALVKETPRETILSDKEVIALWGALKDPSGLRRPLPGGKSEALSVGRPVRIAMQLSMLTLQRRGEISSMREDDLDLDAAMWIVRPEVAKNGKANVVPLSPTAVTLIREALSFRPTTEAGLASPFVFPGRDDPFSKPIAPAALSHAMRDLRASIGANGITTHDLRRSFATRLGDAGVTPFDVGLLLNHSGETGGAAKVTTSTYARSRYLAERKRVVATLERLLLELVGEREADAKVVPINGGVAA